ncbi:PREDICTED: uncharacterized protein LOC104809644 [Tarenaya hassleriana]|uniref:uncharacterized protein LOC104809644 n=1 Tax=Tarenaya hassleriana TaxID=28532 RepID=UPI00053CA4AC|nr:PREDICTED: uncharacterized protein LOC104809644 [Tarenaya hassleriana]
MDILSRMLDKATAMGRLKLHHKCLGPKITHLAFANDILVFSKTDPDSLREVKRLLEEFGNMFGLHVNNDKSEVFFSGTVDAEASVMAAILGHIIGNLPRGAAQSSEALQGTVFLLSKCIIKEINGLCTSFLWGRKGGEIGRTAPRVAWNQVCRLMSEGGLGLRKLLDINMVQRLKLSWHVLTKTDSLWADWLRKNVWKQKGYWEVVISSRHSWNLRKLMVIQGQVCCRSRDAARFGLLSMRAIRQWA